MEHNFQKSLDKKEINHFSSLAEKWWDSRGPFAPLHKINPLRLKYIKNSLCEHFDIDRNNYKPFEGMRILDIGCGGGLLSEPIARLGANVVGADASEKNIQIARMHAEDSALKIDYVHATAEELSNWGEKFDVILNMEVIEHVADINVFLKACSSILNTNGAMTLSTLNRTFKSFAFGILGAEYILRWLPKGTHDWQKFLKPSELYEAAMNSSLEIKNFTGMQYSISKRKWILCNDLSVNYFCLLKKT
tara:strand:- start:3999 stop:4742 length:744 start_codon:yes stop_codon:yes gene_type:complete